MATRKYASTPAQRALARSVLAPSWERATVRQARIAEVGRPSVTPVSRGGGRAFRKVSAPLRSSCIA